MHVPSERSALALLAGSLLLLSSLLGGWLAPATTGRDHPPGLIAAGLPEVVGMWRHVPLQHVPVDLTVATAGGPRRNDRPYDEVVARNYVAPGRRPVMLAIAYAAQQRQEVKIHRPDLCYPAQGWRVLERDRRLLHGLRDPGGPIETGHLLTKRGAQQEVVVYVMRTADSYALSLWSGRLAILGSGLQGEVPDGALLRVSQRLDATEDPAAARAELERFLQDLVRHTRPDARQRLIPQNRDDSA